MIRVRPLVGLLGLLAPLSFAPAHHEAHAAEGDSAATFAQLDANKDGQLTSEEIAPENKRLFERLLRTADANKDGQLTSEEFTAGLKPAERGDGEAAKGDDAQRERKKNKGDKKNRPEGRPAGKIFGRLDANGDGKLALDEVPEERRERFKRLFERGDKNGDGLLDRAEFGDAFAAPPDAPAGGPPEGRGGDAKRFFQRFDKNGDGKLTADEAPEERRAFVDRLIRRGDKDGDQALSLEEFIAVRPERPRPDGARPDPQQPGTPGAENRPRPPQGGPPAGLFFAIDADHDGKLSSGEIASAADVIRKLDRNGDGVVTPDEAFRAPEK